MAYWLRAHPKAAVPEAAAALREAGEELGGEGGGEVLAAAFMLRYRALPVAQARLLRTLTLAPDGVADLRTASALGAARPRRPPPRCTRWPRASCWSSWRRRPTAPRGTGCRAGSSPS